MEKCTTRAPPCTREFDFLFRFPYYKCAYLQPTVISTRLEAVSKNTFHASRIMKNEKNTIFCVNVAFFNSDVTLLRRRPADGIKVLDMVQQVRSCVPQNWIRLKHKGCESEVQR